MDDDLHNAIRELINAIKELPNLIRNNAGEQIIKPLTQEEAADFLSVPLGTLRYWQTVKKIEPMVGLSPKHPRYEKDYLMKILKDGFVDEQISETRERLNKKRRKRT